jgi:hypothetical protein
MQGEIGLDIKNIQIRKYGDKDYEMTFYTKNNECLHIVGMNNDLKSLLEDALANIVERKL